MNDIVLGSGLLCFQGAATVAEIATGLPMGLEFIAQLGTVGVLWMWLRSTRQDITKQQENFNAIAEKLGDQFGEANKQIEAIYKDQIEYLQERLKTLEAKD